jgi:hypothetical protein
MYLTHFALASSDPTNSANALNIVAGLANWINNLGLNHTSNGLYYARTFAPCEPIATAHPGCEPSGDIGLNGEAVNGINMAVLANPAYPKAVGSAMMSAMFSTSGDGSVPPYNGNNLVQYMSPSGYYYKGGGATPWKWFGYFWGIGASYMWPSLLNQGWPSPSNSGAASGIGSPLNYLPQN